MQLRPESHVSSSRRWMQLLLRLWGQLSDAFIHHAKFFLEFTDLILQVEKDPMVQSLELAVQGHQRWLVTVKICQFLCQVPREPSSNKLVSFDRLLAQIR